jgi:hypothetical protein
MKIQHNGCYFHKRDSAMLFFSEIFNFHVERVEMEQWLSLLVQYANISTLHFVADKQIYAAASQDHILPETAPDFKSW